MGVSLPVHVAVAVLLIGPQATGFAAPVVAEQAAAEPAAVGNVGKLAMSVVKASLVEEVPLKDIMPGWTGAESVKAKQAGFVVAAVSIRVKPVAGGKDRVDLGKARLEDAAGKSYDSIVKTLSSCSGERAETCVIPFAVPKEVGRLKAVVVNGVSLAVPEAGR